MSNTVVTRSTTTAASAPPGGRFGWRAIGRGLLGSTPVRFRNASALAAVVLVVFAAVGLTTSRGRARATAHLRDHAAPTLIAAQDVSSSLAEADAAAVAAFLSGATEDRDARAVYERALERVSGSLEQASRLIGDDPAAHEALVRALDGMLGYAGLVESARTARAAALPDATTKLAAASAELGSTVKPAVDALASRASSSVDADHRAATRGLVLAIISGAIALLALVAVGVLLARRTRRVVNLGVVVAAVGVALLVVWSTVGALSQARDIDKALGSTGAGVRKIGDLRTAAYTIEANRSRALVAGTTISMSTLLNTVSSADLPASPAVAPPIGTALRATGLLGEVVDLGGGPRQIAEANEMALRWQAYRDAVLAPKPVASDASAAFTGFNIAVDSVLGSQQVRFLDQIGQAHDRLNHLDPWVAVGALVALGLLVFGVERRVAEYK